MQMILLKTWDVGLYTILLKVLRHNLRLSVGKLNAILKAHFILDKNSLEFFQSSKR